MLAIVFKEVSGHFAPRLCISYASLPVRHPFSIAPQISVPATALTLATSGHIEVTDDNIYGATFSETLKSSYSLSQI